MIKFPNKINLLKRVWAYNLNVNYSTLILIALAVICSATAPLGLPYLFGLVIDGLLSNKGASELYWYLAITTIVLLVGTIGALVSSKLCAHLGYDLAKQLSIRVYDAVLRMRMPTYTTISQGVLTSRLTNDVRMLEPLLVEVPLTTLRSWLTLIGAAIFVMIVDPWFLLAFIVIPLSILMSRISEKKIDSVIKDSFECSSVLSKIIEDTTSWDAIALVRQSGRSQEESERFSSAASNTATIATRLFFWRLNIRTGYDICFSLISVFVLLIGIQLVQQEASTVGGVVAVIIYLRVIRQPLNDLIGLRYPIMRGGVALDRLESVLFSANTNLPLITSTISQYISSEQIPKNNIILEFDDVWYKYPTLKDISVEGLSSVNESIGGGDSFSYTSLKKDTSDEPSLTKNDWALKGLSFSLAQGESLAISGVSGSGKSTMLAIASGFLRPDRGEVKINGLSTKNMSEEEILSNMSSVTQDVYLRHDTLKNNLLYTMKKASEDEMLESCNRAGLESTVNNLPNKLDTDIGFNGKRLSGGERQRISIARAFLQNRQLIFLDEATSNLDMQRENDILKEIEAFRKDKAVLIVAHRETALQYAERVIFLKEGTIADEGKHSDLLKNNDEYSKIHSQ